MKFDLMVQYVTILYCLFALLHQCTTRKRVRKPDSQLHFHVKRQRILWAPLVRYLGPNEFAKHHRVPLTVFNKVHNGIQYHLYTNPKYARQTCCRGETSHVDSRSRLSMTLKHLGGSKMQDIERTHGVSRSTVVNAIQWSVDAIIECFPIPQFPFGDDRELAKIAQGFRLKSSGGCFEHVVGAVDGLLLTPRKYI